MLAMIPAIRGTAAEISEGLLSIVSRRIFSITSNIPAKRGAIPQVVFFPTASGRAEG